MGVCEGEQQHPIRMERGKGEPDGDRKHKITVCHIRALRLYKYNAEGIAQAYVGNNCTAFQRFRDTLAVNLNR